MSSKWVNFPQMWANCGQIGPLRHSANQRSGVAKCSARAVPKRSAERAVWKERTERTEPFAIATLGVGGIEARLRQQLEHLWPSLHRVDDELVTAVEGEHHSL